MTAVAERTGESLAQALDRVYATVAGTAPGAGSEHGEGDEFGDPSWHPFAALGQRFDLSEFELDTLALCAGFTLQRRFGELRESVAADGVAWPSFGLALGFLDAPHWSAVTAVGPLRYWRLVELGRGRLLDAALELDERILEFLLGVPGFDERLQAIAVPVAIAADGSVEEGLVGAAARRWVSTPTAAEPLLLVGAQRPTLERTFCAICARAGLQPYRLDGGDVPEAASDRDQVARLWVREAMLTGAALFVRTEQLESVRALTAWLDAARAPIAVEVRPGTAAERLDGVRLHVRALSAGERREAWIHDLGPLATRMNGTLERIVEYFHFDEAGIRTTAAQLTDAADNDAGTDLEAIGWSVCRAHGRRSLDGLAQRIEVCASWDDLVLPESQTRTLRQIAVHVRRRAIVNDTWGFAAKHARGVGLTAMFAGDSGTGKTMAAEIIASDLDLDLYRIDLAAVVSKYIGETEKNLRAIFDAAQRSGAVLLFDEADALFGKRSEVRDSHDRYANLEISYLLQQMEAYRGVAILTTNMQHAVDPAFMRRIRFVVQFPFPDAAARARIWRRTFPAATPLAEIDFERVGRLNISGGVIRNIATNAAFLAADESSPINVSHILDAARVEYAKLGRPLTASESGGLS